MLRIIATFILIYLIFRVLTAFVFPRIARWYLNRYKKKFYHENPWAAEAEEKRKKENTSHAGKDLHRKPDTDRLGEYVDFEEIKDKNES